jgi:hypothetical protein
MAPFSAATDANTSPVVVGEGREGAKAYRSNSIDDGREEEGR